MDLSYFRRIVAFAYTLVILMFIIIGFCYSNDINDEFRENAKSFSEYWSTPDGKMISLPYSGPLEVEIENTLPVVYGDQILVLRVYYENFEVYIDDKLVLESREHTFLGTTTNVGNKEIWVPLKQEYSGSKIRVKMTIQKFKFGSDLSDIFLTTRSGYGIEQMKKNVPSVILFIVFTVTGIFEICVSAFFIIKRTTLIRKLTFEALFYAGTFSIASAQWIINESRLSFILFGNMTGFSVLNIVVFLLMPLLFFEIARALFFRIGKFDNAIDGVMAVSILVGCFLCVKGVFDWGYLVYLAHALDLIVLVMVGYYSFASLKEDQKTSGRYFIAIANCVFLLLAGVALVQYINNIHSDYIIIVILDLMVYLMVQVGLIYRRIGLNVREEREFAEAKVFAFTDELTKLGNRHHFFNIVADYEKTKLPADLTYIIVDVNRLKYYNDTMGHEAGDELLKGTAECLKRAFTTSSTATIGRIGGDEFAILLIASELETNRRLFNLRHFLERWHGKYINGISVAIGYCASREDLTLDIDGMAKLADDRMYADKKKFYETTGVDRRTSH